MSIDAWGIYNGYEDSQHRWHVSSPETLAALHRAIHGNDDAAQQPPENRVIIVRANTALPGDGRGELTLADGTTLHIAGQLPPDLPDGYHHFRSRSADDEYLLIAGPGKCVLPPKPHGWGWGVQLYATRSRRSWGLGDLADLRELGAWSQPLGAELMLISPLNAVAPLLPQERSPYYPVSRRFRNPLYLRVEEVPGASALADLEALASAGRALNSDRKLDRDAVFRLKLPALERIWQSFAAQGGFHDARFNAFRQEMGASLEEFCTYCVLAERFGKDWQRWPHAYRTPTSADVANFAAANQDRVRFHAWLQWLIDGQLAQAGQATPIVQDLPVGVDPGGADAWAWQHVLVQGATVGAPPDTYNVAGQNWGLPPWNPFRLRAAGYWPFIETIRAMLRHAGGLRIDHALGLFRMWWVPENMEARHGGFVQYPSDELLAIIALESHRAGAYIIGEDLGTVEPHVHAALLEHQLLSYRVVWLEHQPPATFPALSLASITTHDLPTVAGLWSGDDLRIQKSLGIAPHDDATQQIIDRVQEMTGLSTDADAAEAVQQTHRLLATAGSMLKIATLDDALAAHERPNIPSAGSHPDNWCWALPQSLEVLQQAPLAKSIAQYMQNGTPAAQPADSDCGTHPGTVELRSELASASQRKIGEPGA